MNLAFIIGKYSKINHPTKLFIIIYRNMKNKIIPKTEKINNIIIEGRLKRKNTDVSTLNTGQ